jgi:hypothetical protein
MKLSIAGHPQVKPGRGVGQPHGGPLFVVCNDCHNGNLPPAQRLFNDKDFWSASAL